MWDKYSEEIPKDLVFSCDEYLKKNCNLSELIKKKMILIDEHVAAL